ncbi:MAG TPA: hypothetical protein VH475_25760 [Tepidisphaeraceae bacterium]|jgi:hypothetical protein
MPAFLGLGPDNPVAWGNFHRKGGLKTLLRTAGAYLAIVAGLIFLSAHLNARPAAAASAAASAYAGWLVALLGLQFVFMVIIGAGRLSSTIRGDLTSGMIESLRMMPLPARHAVAGYLTATAASLGGFCLVNFVLGLVVNSLSGLPAARWLAANLILLAFAAFVWTVTAFLAFVVRSAAAVMILVSVVGLFGNAGLLYLAPGLVVLAGPLIGGTIFNLRTAQTEFATPLILSLAAQFLVGAIFFAGAARKYRRPHALALGAWLALALLLALIAVSLMAILRPDAFQPGFLAREFRRMDPAVPFCGSTVLALLIALIPLANFARLHVAWVRGRADDPQLRRTVPPPLVAGAIVTAVMALILLALRNPPAPARLAWLVAAFFGFCVSVTFFAAWIYRAAENAKVLLGVWLIAYYLVPLAVDFTRNGLLDRDSDEDRPTLTTAASFSPVGLLIEAVTQPDADLRKGAVFHVLIPLIPIALYLRRPRRPTITHPAPATT